MTLDNMTGITEGSYTGGDLFCKSQLITCNRVKECNGVCPFEDALKHADKEMNEQTVIDHDRDWIIGCIQHDGFIHTHRFDKANQIILDALSADAIQGWIPVSESDDTISRQDALMEARPEYRNPSQQGHESYNQGWNDAVSEYYTGVKMLPSAEPKTGLDCTDFVNWLLEEVMDEETWELNAVAYGEVIARKLKKLGLLEVKDGYYIRHIENNTKESDLVYRPSAETLQNLAEPNKELKGSDLISRQDAIEAVIGACQYVCDCYDNVVTTINALPSAEAEWIPCSERLPEYMVDMWDEGVIATVEGREGNIIYKHGIVPNAWFEEGEWYVNDVKLEHAKVTAWMPLPEPYREEGEDE